MLSNQEISIVQKAHNGKSSIRDQSEQKIEIDFVVDAEAIETPGVSKNAQISNQPIIKRYFSANKPNQASREAFELNKLESKANESKPKISSAKSNTMKFGTSVDDHSDDDWVLHASGLKQPQRKFKFKSTDFVTHYSSHEQVIDKSEVNSIMDMVSGKFRDGDFEPIMSNITGHKKVKTDKDKQKL